MPSPSGPHLPPPHGAAAKTWRAPHQGRSTAHAQWPHGVRVASRSPARAVEPGTRMVIARRRQQPPVAPAFWADHSYHRGMGRPGRATCRVWSEGGEGGNGGARETRDCPRSSGAAIFSSPGPQAKKGPGSGQTLIQSPPHQAQAPALTWNPPVYSGGTTRVLRRGRHREDRLSPEPEPKG